jgi:thiol-disulfide isomerase/thioredoxin
MTSSQRASVWGGVLAVLLGGAALFAFALGRAPAVAGDVRVIAHGEEVDLDQHLARGKYTVVDFYAVWCPPCRQLSPALERLAGRHPDRLAVRKVDIVDWTQPVARQHGIEELPYLVLFDPEGRPAARGGDVFLVLGRVFGDDAREVLAFAGVEVTPASPLR